MPVLVASASGTLTARDTQAGGARPITLNHPPPDVPKQHTNLYERIDWLVFTAVPWLIVEAINTRHELEHLQLMTDSLAGEIARNTTATNAAVAAGDAEIAQLVDISAKLAAALAQLSTSQAPTAEQLAAMQASSQALENLTGRLVADDPAAPTPTPAPTATAVEPTPHVASEQPN